MTPSFKHALPGHNKHNDVNDNTRENVKSMKARYRKKEIGKIGA